MSGPPPHTHTHPAPSRSHTAKHGFEELRVAQAQAVLREVDALKASVPGGRGAPFIFMGDFNSNPEGSVYDVLSAHPGLHSVYGPAGKASEPAFTT